MNSTRQKEIFIRPQGDTWLAQNNEKAAGCKLLEVWQLLFVILPSQTWLGLSQNRLLYSVKLAI
jgi:hypothetical protein